MGAAHVQGYRRQARSASALTSCFASATMNADPIVLLRPSKHDGSYCLSRRPARLIGHNAASWAIIVSILERRGTATYKDLAVAVRGHSHFGTEDARPQHFVAYCIRRGWITRAALID